VLFQLKNAHTGIDYGTLTVGMNRLRLAAGGNLSLLWADTILEEFAELRDEHKQWERRPAALVDTFSNSSQGAQAGAILPVANLRHDEAEDAYVCFIDVFAAGSGYLSWDNDFQLGRCLQDQRLFSISSHVRQGGEVLDDEDRFVQFFNPSDWMHRDSVYEAEPFDHRVSPSFHCGDEVDDTMSKGMREAVTKSLRQLRSMDDKSVKLKEILENALKRMDKHLQDKQQRRDTKPKGPSDLYGVFMRAPPAAGRAVDLKVSIPRTAGALKNMRTRELRKRTNAHGWRGVSHLTVPEPDKTTITKKNLNVPGLGSKSANLHTFMRPVGHLIHAGDKDSRMLARLRMHLPRSIIEDVRRKLLNAEDMVPTGSSNNPNERAADDEEERYAAAQAAAIAALQEEESIYIYERKNANFLCIKFTKPGLIVWAAPPHVHAWHRPGAPLFAVRLLDRPDVVVPVTVPSLDIRYPFESSWYPAKTLKMRSSHLENRIKQRAKMQRNMDERPSKGKAANLPFDAKGRKIAEKAEEESDGEVTDIDEMAPTGYDRPIAVSKNSFVCRLKRKGAPAFDRMQTRNWFRTILEQLFPEVEAECTDMDDVAYTQNFFSSRFMNVNARLVTGLDARETAKLKAHIRCKRVADPEPDKGQPGGLVSRNSGMPMHPGLGVPVQDLPSCNAPQHVDYHALPVENMWMAQSVLVSLNVLTAHELELSSLGLQGKFRPYLVVKLGTEVQKKSVIEMLPKNGDGTATGMGSVYIYQNFQFQTYLPGRTTMTVELHHQGNAVFGDTLVGRTTIDLEDRWFVIKWRDLRAMSNPKYLERHIAPSRVTAVTSVPQIEAENEGWVEPSDPQEPKGSVDRENELKPARGFAEAPPLECLDLTREDGDQVSDSRVGVLRLMMDISTAGSYHADVETSKPSLQEFEIRITIWDVTNISIFRDTGERNDVYVKGKFSSIDYFGNERHAVENTDTHKFANSEASFNWCWKFSVPAPVKECSMELVLMDADRITEDDQIYYPKTFSFNQHLMLAEQALSDGRRSLGPVTETVVFDTWPEPKQLQRCRLRCLRRTLRIDKMKFAKLKMDVQIVRAGSDEAHAFKTGQHSQPKGRVTLSTAVSNPVKTFRMMVGPSKFLRINCMGGCFCFLLLALLILAILYFLMQVLNTGSSGSSSVVYETNTYNTIAEAATTVTSTPSATTTTTP